MTLAEHLRGIATRLQTEIGYPFPPEKRVKDAEEANKIFAYGYAIGLIYEGIREWEKQMKS